MNANNCTDHKSVYRFYKFSIDTNCAEIEDAHGERGFVNHDSLYLENLVDLLPNKRIGKPLTKNLSLKSDQGISFPSPQRVKSTANSPFTVNDKIPLSILKSFILEGKSDDTNRHFIT